MESEPLWHISVVLSHVLMVVIWRVVIAEHGNRLDLCPTTPAGDHVHRPLEDLDSVLTTTTSERVRAVHCPLIIAERLEVGRERATQNCCRLVRCVSSMHSGYHNTTRSTYHGSIRDNRT